MAMGNDMNMQGKRREEAVLMAPIDRDDTLSKQIIRLHDVAKKLDDTLLYISGNLFNYGEPIKDEGACNCAYDALVVNFEILEHALNLTEGIRDRL